MSKDRAWCDSDYSARRRHQRILLGSVCTIVVALALGSLPAIAKDKSIDGRKARTTAAQRASKEPFGNIPRGQLQVFISINQQKLHLYSNGVHVADAPVATGVPGHPTPMGVFSVIQKDRYHRSNIYSDAPMPYMQRITWSGVALHEGENLGHPASHGCIRMPHSFAARLWVLSRLGMRVVIARPELKPTDFADPHLFVHKEPTAPVPTATLSTDGIRTAQTTDASITTDASQSPLTAVPTSQTAPSDPPAAAVVPAKTADVVTDATGAIAIDPIKGESALAEAAKSMVPETTIADASTLPVTLQQAQPIAPAKTAADTSAPAASDADSTPSVTPDLEPVPIPLAKPEALVKIEAIRHAPISIFVSRRTSKIYVRQNFEPLFSAPITIQDPQQPFGTHVFTAMNYMADGSTFRWNVISLPGDAPKATRRLDNEKRFGKYAKERRRGEAETAPMPVETPAAALARVDIPQDVVEQISELIVPGSSLIVSDQGLGTETGDGTDFIVVTR